MFGSKVNHEEPHNCWILHPTLCQTLAVAFFIISFNFCEPQRYKLTEMDIDSICMALSEDEVEQLTRPEMTLIWEINRQNDCRDDFRSIEYYNFPPEISLQH